MSRSSRAASDPRVQELINALPAHKRHLGERMLSQSAAERKRTLSSVHNAAQVAKNTQELGRKHSESISRIPRKGMSPGKAAAAGAAGAVLAGALTAGLVKLLSKKKSDNGDAAREERRRERRRQNNAFRKGGVVKKRKGKHAKAKMVRKAVRKAARKAGGKH